MRVAPPSPMNANDRESLRRELRQRRRALPAADRAAAALAFARILVRHRLLRPGRRIAAYIAHGSEADLSEVIASARRRGCTLYLPTITAHRAQRMEFLRHDVGAALRTNRHGIPEPDPRFARRIAVRQLDLVLVPLVAFDAQGWRLGSGAGYYDRALRHLREGRRWRRPRLIGVGYEFQRVERLQPAPWDVPLDAILTPAGLHAVRRAATTSDPMRSRP
jgi:5-formyltetrahydrofolate cyclo-ligase